MAKKGVSIKGSKEVLKMLQEFEEKGTEAIKRTLKGTASYVATQATSNVMQIHTFKYGGRSVPNTSTSDLQLTRLQQGITETKESDFLYKVYQNETMGAYLEFGTGAFVDVPIGWEDIAWSYYVNGKGYMSPQPYFYPAYKQGEKYLEENMQTALETLTKKYSK